MPSKQTNEATRREWRELGFFYDRDDEQKVWRIVGTKAGICRFADAVAEFASNPGNEPQSEHEHLGPYMYLEIGSWPEPQLTEHWIAGPLSELRKLAEAIRARVALAEENEVLLFREEFAPSSAYELRIEIRREPFDPASEDRYCW